MFKEKIYREKFGLSLVKQICTVLFYLSIHPFLLSSTMSLGVGLISFSVMGIFSIFSDVYKDKYVNEKVEKELKENNLLLYKNFLEVVCKDRTKEAIKKGLKISTILCGLAAMSFFTNLLPVIKILIYPFTSIILVKDTLELADLVLEREVLAEKVKRADEFNKNLNNTKNQELVQEKEYNIEKNHGNDKKFKYSYNPEVAKRLNEKKVITYNRGKIGKKVYRKCR